MFTVEANLNLYALAGTAAVVNAYVNLDEVTTTDTFKAPITLLTTTASVLYTAPGAGIANLQNVVFVNTSSTQVGGVKLFKGSSAIDATRISGIIVIPANGTFIYTGNNMLSFDGTGAPVTGSTSSASKNYSSRAYARATWL